jgi:phosphoadenosine phosphosulfate reductase
MYQFDMSSLSYRKDIAGESASGRPFIPTDFSDPDAPLVDDALTEEQLAAWQRAMAAQDAQERVRFALEHLPGPYVITSSFGIQAAVMLHLVTRICPDIPVVLIDTGYLFAETYRFVEELTTRLQLNLHVYAPRISPGWLEARYGALWNQGAAGIRLFNDIVKVEPARRALSSLAARTWLSGLRRQQASTRQDMPMITRRWGLLKVHPILDWSNRDVHYYLKSHGLPYHPLWEQGYVSVGDWPTSQPLGEGGSEEATRFFGLGRECGLHERHGPVSSAHQDADDPSTEATSDGS